MSGVTITRSGSAATGGGGLKNSCTTVLKDCLITRNIGSYGAGFANSGPSAVMIMEDSSVISNGSLGGGGGCENNGDAVLYLNNCTFANNMGSEIGGAINNYGGIVYLLNSTITANMVNTEFPGVCGGGIGNNGGQVYAVNSLLTNNFEQHSAAGTPYAVKPSDIGVYSNDEDIHLYYTYCGAYVTAITDHVAVTDVPANDTLDSGAITNPAGNGLTDVFCTYGQWSFESCPVLVKLSNGTYAAPLASGFSAAAVGCDVYFDYSASGVTVVAYGSPLEYLIGSSGGTKITKYQGGAPRSPRVIGASGAE